jgi:hypothetical protein
LILDLCNKIWEVKAEANVRTNEEQLQEVEEIMPQIEEMARLPMKMMEDFIPLRKKLKGLHMYIIGCIINHSPCRS